MSWKNEFDERFVRRFTLLEDRENTNIPNCAYSNLLGVSVDASDIKDFIEALIKETEQRASHYAEFLEIEIEGDGYCLEAIRERYKKYIKEQANATDTTD